MAGVNKVILLGNLGRDPEIRHLEGGVTRASFSMATSEWHRDKTTGERKEQTEWHNVVLWRALAESAEKVLKKGTQIYLEGKLRTRKYEKDGHEKYITEVVGETFTVLRNKKVEESADTTNYNTGVESTPAVENASGSDDLPF
jgi:single-strand DNA-binding protein